MLRIRLALPVPVALLVAAALLAAAPLAGARGATSGPPLIDPRSCPRDALALPADAVALAARAALRAERPVDRPRLIAAALADRGGPRGALVRTSCGAATWHRTVAVAIDLRRYHPSASLSERVSFVARTRAGYRVYALGH